MWSTRKINKKSSPTITLNYNVQISAKILCKSCLWRLPANTSHPCERRIWNYSFILRKLALCFLKILVLSFVPFAYARHRFIYSLIFGRLRSCLVNDKTDDCRRTSRNCNLSHGHERKRSIFYACRQCVYLNRFCWLFQFGSFISPRLNRV